MEQSGFPNPQDLVIKLNNFKLLFISDVMTELLLFVLDSTKTLPAPILPMATKLS